MQLDEIEQGKIPVGSLAFVLFILLKSINSVISVSITAVYCLT